MAYYRLYSLDTANVHIVDAYQFDADCDAAAIRHVTPDASGISRELWSLDRKVVDFAPHKFTTPPRTQWRLASLVRPGRPWRWNPLGECCQFVTDQPAALG